MQLDANEDISRAETAIQTIKTSADFNRNSESDREEF